MKGITLFAAALLGVGLLMYSDGYTDGTAGAVACGLCLIGIFLLLVAIGGILPAGPWWWLVAAACWAAVVYTNHTGAVSIGAEAAGIVTTAAACRKGGGEK